MPQTLITKRAEVIPALKNLVRDIEADGKHVVVIVRQDGKAFDAVQVNITLYKDLKEEVRR